MLEKMKVRLEGLSPLIMHNAQLANPLNPIVRQMKDIQAKKKNMTDDDRLELMRLELLGSLYLNKEGRVCVPGENLEGLIRDGAKKSNRGKKVQAGVWVTDIPILSYEGPQDAPGLWEDDRFRDVRIVRVGQARVVRCRPIFHEWSLAFTIQYRPDAINRKDIEKALMDAGAVVGLGDYRPRYGLFAVTILK